MAVKRSSFSVVGTADDSAYHMAVAVLKSAEALGFVDERDLECSPLLEPEFEKYISEAKPRLGGSAFAHSTSPLIEKDGKYMGGLRELVGFIRSTWPSVSLPDTSDVDFEEHTKKELVKLLSSTGNSYCYMDFKIGEERAKRVYFELFHSICPRTCENFSGLCAGVGKLKYRNSLVHRVVPGAWVQGGDIVTGKGDGGVSIFGECFEDECFSVKFDQPGILAMANKGPHTNGSQFFVTTETLPCLNTKSVAFGRVIKGMSVVRKMESVPCFNERPEDPVKVEKAGVIDLSSTIDIRL